MILETIGQWMAVLGALIFVFAGVGLHRFRDPYSRISAVATAAGLGVALVTIGAVFQVPDLGNLAKAGLAVVLQLMTSAVAAIVIARAAVSSRHRFTADTDVGVLESEEIRGEGVAGAGEARDAPDERGG
ncbi:MAG: monovalent cation/H(+) antiporter subunit G [bacterium]|nr:monovalent cation/H(+) antiporter subunit G [bacterium]